MTKILDFKIDPLTESAKNLMVISFIKSGSSIYPMAVELAQQAQRYEESRIGTKPVHIAVFGKKRDDAIMARILLGHTYGWKGTQIYAGKKLLQDAFQVKRVLECYLEATGCSDWRAHCYVMVNDPNSQSDRYAFPCRIVYHRFHYQSRHPSSMQDQIQAIGIREGCDWCPLFNPSNYLKVEKSPQK